MRYNRFGFQSNKHNVGTMTPTEPAVINISHTLSGNSTAIAYDYEFAGNTEPRIDYSNVTVNIDTNVANATLFYTISGNVSTSDFIGVSSLTGNVVCDSSGNANIQLPIDTTTTGDKHFTVSLQRNATSTSNVAVSNTFNIYYVQSPTISGGDITETITTQGGVDDIFIKSRTHKFYANGNLTVTSFGTSQNLSYAKVFGGTGTKAYFAGNNSVIKGTLIAGGSSGGNSVLANVGGYGIGGSAGQVSNVKIAFSELSSGSNPVTVGAGGNIGVSVNGALGGGGNTTFLTYSATGGSVLGGSGNGFSPGAENNAAVSYGIHSGGGGAGALENGSDANTTVFDPGGTPHIPGGDGGAGPLFANSLTYANYGIRGFPGNVDLPLYYFADVANTTVFQDNPILDMDTPSTGNSAISPMFDLFVSGGGGGFSDGLNTMTQTVSRSVVLTDPNYSIRATGFGSGGDGKVNSSPKGLADAGFNYTGLGVMPGGGGGGGPGGSSEGDGSQNGGTWPGEGGRGLVWIRYPYVATPFRYIIDQEF